MIKNLSIEYVLYSVLLCLFVACKTPGISNKTPDTSLPASFVSSLDTINSGHIQWRQYFNDPYLIALIDTALLNNQELNITMQEIEVSKNEVLARKGEYLPFVSLGAAAGVEQAAEYTRNGAVEESLEIKPGVAFPKPLPDFMLGVHASWELDIWKKLRNARKAAVMRYAATMEGRNFMVTNIIAEIAHAYYELLALDNLLEILQRNMELQRNALEVVRVEKEAAKVTQLAVNRFEAQMLHTQNLQYEIRQQIVETENKINFLVGRFPQPIIRSTGTFNNITFEDVTAGIPSQLLTNRPDIRKAELEIEAAGLDVKAAKANFYPSIRLTAGVGLQSFNPAYLIDVKSILYNIAGDLVSPLVNRRAIKAIYFNANAKQIQAVYDYEQAILNAHIEVVNQLFKMDNYKNSYETKSKEVEILNQSNTISNNLFASARADYIEVLLTQREALESKVDLVEIKLKQLETRVDIYKALGGGWN